MLLPALVLILRVIYLYALEVYEAYLRGAFHYHFSVLSAK